MVVTKIASIKAALTSVTSVWPNKKVKCGEIRIKKHKIKNVECVIIKCSKSLCFFCYRITSVKKVR